MMSNSSLNAHWMQRDLSVLWHPCTQMKDHESIPVIPIKKAQGLYLEDFEGNRYLDAISSWWTTLFGHCHPYIIEIQHIYELARIATEGIDRACLSS